jgi:hypothetical protein
MESESRADTALFRALVRSLLRQGISVRFRAHGRSMFPAIRDTEIVQVDPAQTLDQGEVALLDTAHGPRIHRIIAPSQTRGDCCLDSDPAGDLLGKVTVLRGETASRVSAMTTGTRVRRWIARWRGHF